MDEQPTDALANDENNTIGDQTVIANVDGTEGAGLPDAGAMFDDEGVASERAQPIQ